MKINRPPSIFDNLTFRLGNLEWSSSDFAVIDLKRKGSALDAVTWQRAAERLGAQLSYSEVGPLGPWFGTVGDPKLRFRPRNINQFNPDKVLRRWRSAIEKLRKLNPKIRGVCIVELQLCRQLHRPGDGQVRHFYEPHFHFIIYGVSKADVISAFQVRRNPNVKVRTRSTKVQSVYNLEGALRYITKARPEYRRQFVKDGAKRWGRSRFPARHLDKWRSTMSQYSVAELLTTTGLSTRFLREVR